MHIKPVLPRTLISLALLAMLAGGALLARAYNGASADSVAPFRVHSMVIHPLTYTATQLHVKPSQVARPVQFDCQSNVNPQPSLCYGPYQIRKAYGVDDLLARGYNGKGVSIAVIDSYGSPYIKRDLSYFDHTWGIDGARMHVYVPYGTKPAESAWYSETALDVEWAHVMAPQATINLIEARSSDDIDLYNALKFTLAHHLGDIFSLSFGENEACIDAKLRNAEHALFLQAAQQGITVLAATGDYGAAQYTCDNTSLVPAVAYPASDPLVTAVGGTALLADAMTGAYQSEATWNESDTYNSASGGGFSSLYSRPDYQANAFNTSQMRGLPDISINSSISGGVTVSHTDTATGRIIMVVMGGTSVATPEMAGLLADGVQMAHHRLGAINPILYQLAHNSNKYNQIMNDITLGDNFMVKANINGYFAATGWDPATGLGSPGRALSFLRGLLTK
jgi:subtilase family serine protease